MNRLNFNQTGGFPLSTNILDAMQTAYSVFNSLGELAGNFAIISGCAISGTSVTNGVVYINGEVLEFVGGGISTNVIIKEETESRVFEDGSTKNVIYKRYATFGSSTPDKTYSWANFKRIENLIEQGKKNIDFEARLKKLEEKPAELPIGVIMRYNQPMSVPPPDGWEDYSPIEERGRVWVAHNPDDTDFTLGRKGGEKQHILDINEIPSHSHKFINYPGREKVGTGNSNAVSKQGNFSESYNADTTNSGGNQPHNNLQPYIAVRLIIKVK